MSAPPIPILTQRWKSQSGKRPRAVLYGVFVYAPRDGAMTAWLQCAGEPLAGFAPEERIEVEHVGSVHEAVRAAWAMWDARSAAERAKGGAQGRTPGALSTRAME
jgi:hypothetical protein